MARLRNYFLTPEVVLWMIQDKHPDLVVRVTGGPPVGSRVRSVDTDYRTGTFVLTVEHDSFDDVPEGAPIPTADSPNYICVARQTVNDEMQPVIVER